MDMLAKTIDWKEYGQEIESRKHVTIEIKPLVPPAHAGKVTRKLFDEFNAKQAAFANIGQRLSTTAQALSDARTAYASNPTDAALDALASAKNANDVLVSTGVKNDPDFFANLQEDFKTPELFKSLALDCEALAARFTKSASTAREKFADSLHAKVLNGEHQEFAYDHTPASFVCRRAHYLMERLEERRDFLAAQSRAATIFSEGGIPASTYTNIIQSLENDPETISAQAAKANL